ncbi:hypothetical protein C2I18_17260 [Paenibacillus sp. PK3_47]|uniref:sensor histidine kinase n=1 Tax=Paenibacillus sp. PK3_47 TaxID=2072642 RepID=UPI00201DBF0E|nr:sensor histidine kinase [Paenibacillus sp. PK3_47]UQZ35120.1 hypothetical protein C2I18_17260 [Paenibacillus sp. PK3_47]
MTTALRDEIVYFTAFPLIPVILHYFFSGCFRCRIGNRWIVLSLYGLYTACHMALHHIQLPGLFLLAANTGLIMGVTFFYQGSLLWRLYSSLFVTALIFLSDAVIPLSYTDTGYLISLLLSKLLILLFVFVLLKVVKSNGRGDLAGWYWCLLFLSPLLSIAALVRLSDNLFFQSYPQLFPVVPVLLLAINLLIFVLSDRIMCVQTEQARRKLLEQQNTYYANQYLMTRNMQEEAFKFKHDFKNILLGLRARLAAGDEDKSIHELDRLLGANDTSAGSCSTGNLVIDSMINYKEQVAGNSNIPFRLEVNIPPDLLLDTTVMSVILGNALDNAIEAVKSIPEKAGLERYAAIHMHYLNDSLFLRIRNPYDHDIRTGLYGELRSSKPDTGAHGIGLQNIRRAVEEYGGLLDITYDSGVFQVEIVLFNIQRQHTA